MYVFIPMWQCKFEIEIWTQGRSAEFNHCGVRVRQGGNQYEDDQSVAGDWMVPQPV